MICPHNYHSTKFFLYPKQILNLYRTGFRTCFLAKKQCADCPRIQILKICGAKIGKKFLKKSPKQQFSDSLSKFVWKNGGKSVGRASRVQPSGFEKAVKFCSGAFILPNQNLFSKSVINGVPRALCASVQSTELSKRERAGNATSPNGSNASK